MRKLDYLVHWIPMSGCRMGDLMEHCNELFLLMLKTAHNVRVETGGL